MQRSLRSSAERRPTKASTGLILQRTCDEIGWRSALRELGECDVNACPREELAGLLDAAQACLLTRVGFEAVDLGGL
jgi:hypothetical protein